MTYFCVDCDVQSYLSQSILQKSCNRFSFGASFSNLLTTKSTVAIATVAGTGLVCYKKWSLILLCVGFAPVYVTTFDTKLYY